MKYKATQKDRYGNMKSIEIQTEGQLEVPPMTSMIPQYEAVGGLAKNHPGEPRGSDTVPAWLTPGEFVVNKEAVDIFGPQIKKMNDVGRDIQNGEVPMYATEGVEVPILKPEEFNADYISEVKTKITNNKQKDIYNYLKNKYKLKDNVIAAIMGQIDHESSGSFDPSIQYGQKSIWSPEGAKPGVAEGLFQNELQGNIAIGTRYDEWLKSKGLENNRENRDNTKNQIDFFMEGITKAGAVPHHDGSGYWIGEGRAKELQKAFASDMSAQEIGKLITTNYLNPDKPRPEQRAGSIDDMSMRIESGMFKPGFGMPLPFKNLEQAGVEKPTNMPSPLQAVKDGWRIMLDTLRGNSNETVQELDNAANINQAGGIPHTEMVIPELPVSKPKPNERPLDSSSEYDFKNKGGPIYASQGVGLGTYEEEMLKNLQNDYGSILNPFDTTYSSGFDYGDATMPESYKPPVPIPTPDVYADPNKITPPPDVTTGQDDFTVKSMSEVPVPNEFIMNPNELDNLGQQNDRTSIMNMGDGTLKNVFEPPRIPEPSGMIDPNLMEAMEESDVYVPSYDPQGLGMEMADPTYMSSYDKMVQDELTGEPAYEIRPPYEAVDKNMYDSDTGDIIDPDAENKFFPRRNIYDDALAQNDKRQISAIRNSIKKLNDQIKDRDKSINNLNSNDPKYTEKVARLRKEIVEFENKLSEEELILATKLAVTPGEGPEPLYKTKVNDAGLIMEIQKNKKILEDKGATKSEKELAQQRLDALNAEYAESDSAKVTNVINENQEKLAKIAAQNKITDNKDAQMKEQLSSKTGAALLENESKDPAKYQKAKDAMSFLFGDLIDGQEIGRAIAVYLASRALGYSHSDTIGFVAKNYLKRVDAKNAAMDKFIRENAGKFTKKSLADYKRTGDPNMLMPIGMAPAYQGERETWYDKNGASRVAFKFSRKRQDGQTETYWSYDEDGSSVVPTDHHQDASKIKTTDEYKKKRKENSKFIADKIKEVKDEYDIDKVKDPKKNQYVNTYFTKILPNTDADTLANWMMNNNVDPLNMGSIVQIAYLDAIEDARKTGVKPTSLLKYLEAATIKDRVPLPNLWSETIDGKDYNLSKEDLVKLNDRVVDLFADPTTFYNEIYDLYTTGLRDDDTPWTTVFLELAKKNPKNIPPFALYVDNALQQEEEARKKK